MAAMFEGDNGGATSAGVSATEIRVAVPVTSTSFLTSTSASSVAQRDAIEGLFDYFNNRFELYGRRLVPVYVAGAANTALAGRTLAAQVGASEVFAAMTGPLEKQADTPQAALAHQLARDGVVSVWTNRSTWWSDRQVFDELHPYVWSVYPSAEQLQAQLGALACSLAGKPANYTPDPDLAGRPRKFGILAAGYENPPNPGVLAALLEACTGEAPERLSWAQLANPDNGGLRTGFEQLASAGVTTVVCVCERWYIDTASWAGSGPANHHPEWILPQSGYFGGDEYLIGVLRQYDYILGETLMAHAGPPMAPIQAQPWFQALMTTRSATASSSSQASGGAYANTAYVYGEPTYRQLLLLATGIQAAGPNLTADTFAQGLMTAQFPNPGAGRAPAWQPEVGFGPGDHGFYNDFAVGWWSETATPLDPGNQAIAGSWCYVGQGSRFRPTTVPRNLDEMLFQPPCR